MTSPSPHTSGANGALPSDQQALALFIGGAGDKKSYYLAGPYRKIAYALTAFDQRIEEAGLADGYQSLSGLSRDVERNRHRPADIRRDPPKKRGQIYFLEYLQIR